MASARTGYHWGVPRNRPLIAVTSSEMRDPPAHLAKAEADPRQQEMALGLLPVRDAWALA